jgi:transposase
MTIVTVGIDLAKNVFAVHGVDEGGKPALVRPSVARAKLLELIASLPPCLIGMEACSGAHHWAREFAQFGHTVRLMAPKFVAPYRLSGKRGKNDAADAQAICEAVTRPNMRFVPVKTVEQQGQLMVHRARQSTAAQQLMQLSGVGVTTATVIVSTVVNGHDFGLHFACGCQFCAWLGLVPGQYRSGGTARLGRITKAGDPYLRSLLVLGARSVLALAMRLSMTYDNGKEMAHHQDLSEATGIKIYFAHPYSPWERGINENTNGLLRRVLPKGSDLSVHTQEQLDAIAFHHNAKPRKSLGWKSPAELFLPGGSFDFQAYWSTVINPVPLGT